MSILGKLVAVRYVDGRVVKGWTADFNPQRPLFHVKEDGTPNVHKVRLADLKAVFFIRTPGGDPSHEERKEFELRQTPERRIWVRFKDGEELAGFSSAMGAGGSGFYISPPDPDSNMERAYVLRAATSMVLQGTAAKDAAEKYRARGADDPARK